MIKDVPEIIDFNIEDLEVVYKSLYELYTSWPPLDKRATMLRPAIDAISNAMYSLTIFKLQFKEPKYEL